MNLHFKIFVMISHIIALTLSYKDEMDVGYILRADLMPGSLLMLDSENQEYVNSSRKDSSSNKHVKLSSNGSWYDAYSTMGFHRKMLNEYLCRNFLADEIISQLHRPLITHKVGRPFSKPKDKSPGQANNRKSRADAADVKSNLLSDPGSSNYRDWLTKTATLEDVYRHYDMTVSRAGEHSVEEEYDGGDFTGYAMPGPGSAVDYGPNQPSGPGVPHTYGPPAYIPQPGPHGEADKFGGGGYDYTPHHVHFHDSEKSSQHGVAIHDMFDLALTALAFLSFGMFILQVIMCITANKPMVPMMQMTDGGGDGTEDPDETDEGIRFKRETRTNRTSINELSRRILNSIEAGMAAQEDNGACLRWSLCDNNSYARELHDNQKIWIPVWGLGMSWLSSRLIRGTPSSSAMLESLRACAFGLARSNCTKLYSDCNLRHLLDSRKINREKRAVASSGTKKVHSEKIKKTG